MAREKGVSEVDVSGLDERGRLINSDIPLEEQRSKKGKSKSDAKKRLNKRQSEAKKKKRQMEEDDAPQAKKRKRKKRAEEPADVVVAAGTKKKRKKKTVGELLSEGKTERARKKVDKLASKAMTVAQDVGVEEQQSYMPSSLNQEADFLQEYYHIYGTLGSIIRNLEQRMTEPGAGVNSKDVYALMTMYSQMRETIADLRSIKDMNEQAEELGRLVFDPAAKGAGESLVNLYFKVTSVIRQKVDDPAAVQEILETVKRDIGEQAGKMQEQFSVARSRIVDILNGGS